jgi:hypothetical protein
MAMRDFAVAAFAKNAGQLRASRILGECGYSNVADCTLAAFLANAATAMLPTARFSNAAESRTTI